MQNASSPGFRRRIIWSIAAVLAVAVVAAGAFNAIALPGCASCHDRNGFRAATAASPHAKVDCRSCHVPAGLLDRLAFGLGQTFHMFVPLTGGSTRDAAAVPASRCLACHSDVEKATVVSNQVRIAHATCDKGASCSDCHSATAHGKATSWVRTYDMERCLVCHVVTGRIECDLCHQGRLPANRIVSGTFAVTHGPQWRATHGMGNSATCTVCHKADACAGCHGPGLPHAAGFVETHSTFALDKKAKCDGCHARKFCDDCHGTPMPHGAQFTPGHAKAAAAEPLVCKRCHVDSDCTGCHVAHVHPGGAVGGTRFEGGGD